MPLDLSLACGLNSAIWLVYSILVHDVSIGIANAAGVALSLLQLGAYAYVVLFLKQDGGTSHRKAAGERTTLKGHTSRGPDRV